MRAFIPDLRDFLGLNIYYNVYGLKSTAELSKMNISAFLVHK